MTTASGPSRHPLDGVMSAAELRLTAGAVQAMKQACGEAHELNLLDKARTAAWRAGDDTTVAELKTMQGKVFTQLLGRIAQDKRERPRWTARLVLYRRDQAVAARLAGLDAPALDKLYRRAAAEQLHREQVAQLVADLPADDQLPALRNLVGAVMSAAPPTAPAFESSCGSTQV